VAHDPDHGPVSGRDLGSAFKWAIVLNATYVSIEAAAGLTIGSLALLADAAHNLTDAAGVLKSALGLSLDGVPASLDRAVDHWLSVRPGVVAVHDHHIWSLSTTSIALTAHLVMPDGCPGDDFLDRLAHELEDTFGISHTTLQIETGDGPECRLAPAEIV
jgi:cobalt-zinc-cadmium efflux system protein